jgi:hypothetical protein
MLEYRKPEREVSALYADLSAGQVVRYASVEEMAAMSMAMPGGLHPECSADSRTGSR